MVDDKRKRGGADRRTVSGSEGDEVAHFAHKHGISTAQAEHLIQQHGNAREELDAAAKKLKAG